eukprot:15335383-Alexandrium_andersonii.AAC.1
MKPSPLSSGQRSTSRAMRAMTAEFGLTLSTGNPRSATNRATAGCVARSWEMQGASNPSPCATGCPHR